MSEAGIKSLGANNAAPVKEVVDVKPNLFSGRKFGQSAQRFSDESMKYNVQDKNGRLEA